MNEAATGIYDLAPSPEGMKWVFVNGTQAIEKGRHTGLRAGKVLKKK